MNIREKIRQVRLDRALDKINRQCAVLDETFWSDMAVQIRGHLAYVADSEAQTRRLGIVKANTTEQARCKASPGSAGCASGSEAT